MPLTLSCSDRQELERRVRSQSLRADDVRRARLLLLLADGESYSSIQAILGCSSAYISRWKKRFEEESLSGLHGRQQGRQATVLTPVLEAQILEKTRQKPSDGSTHWSTRKLAKELGVRHQLVATVWSRARVKPHRMERYMASDDPEFTTKAADVIGLYLKPPQHAAVFCVDEKTAIQALIVWTRSCRFRQDGGWRGTDSSTAGMALFRSMRPWTRKPEMFSAAPQNAIPAKSLWHSSAT